MSTATERRVRLRARVNGTVQGVGFRPFVYRLARAHRLAGFVLNDEHGVVLEVEGPEGAVERFMAALRAEAPPLARIDFIAYEWQAARGEEAFTILKSTHAGEPDALIAPDSATCPDCLAELLDPRDRRYRYPFINCTNCGPRFTIVRGVPYDRPQTTMAGFRMCADCQREYDDPGDRRFHAQPNACPACGPRARLVAADGSEIDDDGSDIDDDGGDAVRAAASRLASGAIVAVKGLGGFHLACDAADERAVAALRARKHREDKPFALMVASVQEASALAALGHEELTLLESIQRPIVLAPRRPGAPVADAVAPCSAELGLMLPYAPLHHLLLRDFLACGGGGALVMTSGNVSDEPIAFRDEDALERLAPIADLFLIHDRPIETRTDDSVVRVVDDASGRARPLLLRRSRGYVPAHVELPVQAARPLLACGAEQKSTFCVAKGSRAWVSHHIGDLEQYATLRAFEHGIDHFQRLFAVAPEVVVHDLHPGYLSTAYALEREGVELIAVQHHHAHLAACLAEHGLRGPAVGAIFDGTGYGLDGAVWGGELLVGELLRFERVGSVRPVPLPGGAAAIREPWRMAFAWLSEAFGEPPALPPQLAGTVSERAWRAIGSVARSAELSPVTTSIGRLFDAVGALCGIRSRVSYEGQAAVELEAAAARAGSRAAAGYELGLTETLVIDPRPAVRAIWRDLVDGRPVASIAAGFHRALARVTARSCALAAARHGLDTVVLSGGVFQNRVLLTDVAGTLCEAGLRVLWPTRLPPNDGGISYGQAAIAAAMLSGS